MLDIHNTIDILLQSDFTNKKDPDGEWGRQDLKMLILTLAVAFLFELSLSTNMVHIELPEAEYLGWVQQIVFRMVLNHYQ